MTDRTESSPPQGALEQLRVGTTAPLRGQARVVGAKNAALPILAATLLTQRQVTLVDVPNLSDTQVMMSLLRFLGARVQWSEQGGVGSVMIDATELNQHHAPEAFTGKMRASTLVLGPLLVRFGQATVALPGGCEIGDRPIDIHLAVLESLGVRISHDVQAQIRADVPTRIAGGEVHLSFPSVGATEQALTLAMGASDEVRIRNAAREPEVVDLCQFLTRLGADITGAGCAEITVRPPARAQRMHGAAITHPVIADRLVLGTLLAALAVTGGDLVLTSVTPEMVTALEPLCAQWQIAVAACAAHHVNETGAWRFQKSRLKRVQPISVTTGPWPQFPTDLQPQAMAVACFAKGVSTITETVFERRLHHSEMLARLGAQIAVVGNRATITGGHALRGAFLEAGDIRASAGLMIAALGAEGVSTIAPLTYLDRGYEALDQLLRSLGADCRREPITNPAPSK